MKFQHPFAAAGKQMEVYNIKKQGQFHKWTPLVLLGLEESALLAVQKKISCPKVYDKLA